MNGKLSYAVRFARFCIQWKIDPTDAATLIQAIKRAFKAGEKDTWKTNYKGLAPAQSKVEKIAKGLKLTIEWSGLYPTVTRDKRTVFVPVD